MNRKRCQPTENDLECFMKTYFPEKIFHPFNAERKKIVHAFTVARRRYGAESLMYRSGAGATTIAQCATLWMILTESRRFVLYLGPCRDAGRAFIQDIQDELNHNDLLVEDFPGMVGQCRHTPLPERTRSMDLIAIPNLENAAAFVSGLGIFCSLRGHHAKGVRPDMVIVDNVGTCETRASAAQTAKIHHIVRHGIPSLSFPTGRHALVILNGAS